MDSIFIRSSNPHAVFSHGTFKLSVLHHSYGGEGYKIVTYVGKIPMEELFPTSSSARTQLISDNNHWNDKLKDAMLYRAKLNLWMLQVYVAKKATKS